MVAGKREFTRLLDELGISPDEEWVYRALLRARKSSLSALARATELRPADVRRVLESLQQKGLASRSAESRDRFVPADPDVALEVLILRRQEALERSRLSVRQLVEEVKASARRRSSRELVEIVTGQEAITQRFDQVQRAAKREVMGVDKPPYATAGGLDQNAVEMDLLRKGIRYRAIYDQSVFDLPGKLALIREITAAGEQARLMEDVPMRLVIADHSLGLIPLSLSGPDMEEGDILIHASPLLEALILLFETLWVRAAPLQFVRPDSANDAHALDDFGAEDQALIVLIAANQKDDMIARQLGIGRRTVQRKLRRLMAKVGVSSRVQLAVEAAKRGLI